MSRCCPYPPPGYIPRNTVEGSLIESIKLQRETKKTKEERHHTKAKKEKKKEKKEKKREKKEKKEVKDKTKHIASDIGDGELNYKKGQAGEVGLVNLKDLHSQRIRKDEAEQLERSDLTEEYGQPINSQNSCHSSDSTENCRKRKRDPSLSSDTSLSSGSSTHGNIIRLRLQLPKSKEPEASLAIPKPKNLGASAAKEQIGSERLLLPKNYGPEASLGKGQGISMRPPLLKQKEPEASVSKEQSNSKRLPLLKRKEPEASVSKEQISSMPLPLLKRKEPEALPSKEHSRTMRQPLQKQKEHEASVSKEQSSSMGLPVLKRRAPEASVNKEQSSSMRLASHKKEKERSYTISKHKEPETSSGEERKVWTPLPKQREPDASLRQESCSTSGRVDLPAQQNHEISGQSIEAQPIFSMRTGAVDQRLKILPDQQSHPSTTHKMPEVVQNDVYINKGSSSSSSKSRRQKAELRYKALMDEWVPPVLQVELTDDSGDQDGWLFQNHGGMQGESKQHGTVNHELSNGSWPCAQFLPVADVYALPFTVPF